MARRSNPRESHDQVEPVVRKDLEKKNKSRALGGLVQRSSILACRGYWTIVPKGAILHVPPEFQDRVSEKPAGELLKWRDFHSRNHGWIFTQPVQIANARGEAKLPAHVLKNHRQLGQVVVAVLHPGPISVNGPQGPHGDQGLTLSPINNGNGNTDPESNYTDLASAMIDTNGPVVLNYSFTTLSGPDLTKIEGEEVWSVYALDGGDNGNPLLEGETLESTTLQVCPIADATFSGIDTVHAYEKIPTITVTLNDLYRESTTICPGLCWRAHRRSGGAQRRIDRLRDHPGLHSSEPGPDFGRPRSLFSSSGCLYHGSSPHHAFRNRSSRQGPPDHR